MTTTVDISISIQESKVEEFKSAFVELVNSVGDDSVGDTGQESDIIIRSNSKFILFGNTKQNVYDLIPIKQSKVSDYKISTPRLQKHQDQTQKCFD